MISKHISEEEAFKSQTAIRHGIKNQTTDAETLANMKHVAENVFEPIITYEWQKIKKSRKKKRILAS